MSRKADKPLPPRTWWIRIGTETHGVITGLSTTLCGLPLPAEAKQGTQRRACEACKKAEAGAPILTPQMEADWWAKFG